MPPPHRPAMAMQLRGKRPDFPPGEPRKGDFQPPTKPVPDATEVNFVFTGQGAQWAGMGRELLTKAKNGSVFRDSIRRSGDFLLTLGAQWDLEAELLRDETEGEASLLNTAEVAKPGLTAIQVAVVDLLKSLGVKPHAVVGHSSGEIAGAYAAGHISQRAAIGIAYHGSFQGSVAKSRGLPRGAMMAVGMGEEEMKPYMQGLTLGEARIACVNSPKSVTLSGDADAINEVAARLAAVAGQSIFHRRLQVDTAYHSHHMLNVADDYLERLASMPTEGNIPTPKNVFFVSSVTGQVKTDAVETLVRSVVREPKPVFIEIGPHSALAGPFRQTVAHLNDETKLDFGYSSVLQRKINANVSALSLAGFLFERGVHVDFKAVSALSPAHETALVRSDLPTYKWDHTVKHWHESRISRDYRLRPDLYHDLLGVRLSDSTAIEPRWRHMVGLATLPWLADHVVDGLIIFPGSAYLCMAIEAVVQITRQKHPSRPLETVSVTDVSFLRGLVIPDSPQQRVEVQLSFEPKPNSTIGFRFRITALTDGQWYEHCKGDVEGVLIEDDSSNELLSWPAAPQPSSSRHVTTTTPDDVYRELVEAGNKYGPTFRGIQSFAMTDEYLDTSTVIVIPNVSETMPARHQEPHIIHPSTLDIIFHTCIPMIGRHLGKGAAMPVRLEELLLSVDIPSSPSSELSVLATLTSTHFRAAHADTSKKPEICYAMNWQPDIDHVHAEGVSSFHDLVGYIFFKRADLRVAHIQSMDQSDLTLSFIGSVDAHRGSMSKLDLLDVGAFPRNQADQKLLGFPKIRRQQLHGESSIADQGFEENSYDVVLISDIGLLNLSVRLLKPGELLVATLNESQVHSLDKFLQDFDIELQTQLEIYDTAHASKIIMLRKSKPTSGTEAPGNIQILTHSSHQHICGWVTALEKYLRNHLNCIISIDAFNMYSVYSHNRNDTRLIIVADDQPQSPILSDTSCFRAVTSLLKQEPANVLWISPDDPLPMHQVVGFSRTAHAENDRLRLTTVHVAPTVLGGLDNSKQEMSEKLLMFLSSVLRSLNSQTFHFEREYRVNESGTILIPRLHPSQELNRSIRQDHDGGSNGLAGEAIFIKDDRLIDLPLDAAEIEIETHATSVSQQEAAGRKSFFEYAGVVSKVGSLAKPFAVSDLVVAVSPAMGASRLRVSAGNAGLLPSTVCCSIGAGLLASTMTACHALGELACLPAAGTLLIHGAFSTVGRAAIAVAFSRGARVIVTARDNREARLLGDQLGISVDNVLVTRASLYRRRPRVVFGKGGIDVILQVNQDPVPPEAVPYLKRDGRFVIIGSVSSATLPGVAAIPDGVRVLYCTAEDIVQNPGPSLVARAADMLSHVPQTGWDYWVRDVSLAADALQLVRSRTTSKVILQAGPDSFVQAVVPDPPNTSLICDDASYVVAGGLGDLGQRLMILLAQRGARHFVTLSRRVADPIEIRDLQARLDQVTPGCCVYCISCDITSDSSLQDAADSLRRMRAPLYDDIRRFQAATGVKVDGTLALERAFASPDLDFFLLMSSAVTIVGTSGQGNYNAGNAVLDALAHVRDKASSHYMSINIGLIEDTTSHVANLEAWTRSLARAGLKPVGPDEFTRFFDHILSVISTKTSSVEYKQIHHAMFGFDGESLLGTTSRNATCHSALFAHVFDAKLASTSTTNTSDGGIAPQTLAEVLASGESASYFISNAIADRLARLISADSTSIDQESRSILELGLDSLVAIELRNWIMSQFDAPLQSSEILTNQTIHTLAEKVLARSSIATLTSSDESDLVVETPNSTQRSNGLTHLPLPMPPLSDILIRFKESRRAVASDTEQHTTASAVQAFEEGVGLKLQKRIEDAGPDAISDAFDQLIYLEWREPLMEQGQFYFVHSLEASVHSQLARAATLTMATMQFERLLVAGQIAPHSLHGVPVSSKGYEWLFSTTRCPGLVADQMIRYPPNSTVAILRRGHVFLLELPNRDTEMELSRIYTSYQEIIKASEKHAVPVCTLTSNDRVTWTKARGKLELNTDNASALASIESAAFVVCLDDEEPTTAGERHMQFLLNGTTHHMENRWTDKPFQLAVTANGISAGIYDHSKVDGLDGRAMHRYITRSLFGFPSSELESLAVNVSSYPMREVTCNLTPATMHDIELAQQRCKASYHALDYQTFQASNLNPTQLRNHRVSPNATAYLTTALATYLVDGRVRPSWEVVSQAQYARGRIEWVQTVTPAVRKFIEAAAAKCATRDIFNTAASSYSRAISTAAAGQGFVNHLPRAVGVDQGLKTGFMPEDDDEEEERLYGWHWDAGSFLVTGEGNAYIHCDVLKDNISFNISGYAEYTAAVYEAFKQASEMVSSILRLSLLNNTAHDDKELKRLIIHDLARLHAREEYPFEKDEHMSSAFAYFGPGQFSNMWQEIIKPNSFGQFYLIGAAASSHHAWIVGALESVIRAVYVMFQGLQKANPGFEAYSIVLDLLKQAPTDKNEKYELEDIGEPLKRGGAMSTELHFHPLPEEMPTTQFCTTKGAPLTDNPTYEAKLDDLEMTYGAALAVLSLIESFFELGLDKQQ
uniref:Carrier domain-containing protein n=1 Tax=Bionectria ochroleuca TaxID=29856 RepID=A0A8H7K927_BIOOC